MRFFWISFGTLSLALGIIGIFLPLMPTVVFLLIAAFCYARSSERLHGWLITHPRLGPPIVDWNRSGAIRRRAKWLASVSLLAALGLSTLFGVGGKIIAIQVVVLFILAIFIWSRPEA